MESIHFTISSPHVPKKWFNKIIRKKKLTLEAKSTQKLQWRILDAEGHNLLKGAHKLNKSYLA